MIEKLKQRYARYTEEARKVRENAKPLDGFLGFGNDPRNNPCHMAFYEDLQQWAKDFSASGPGEAEIYEAVRFLLETPAEFREEPCFGFMYVAQGLTREWIPRLTAAQCAFLRDGYDSRYPKRDRMPLQNEVYKLLKKGAGRK